MGNLTTCAAAAGLALLLLVGPAAGARAQAALPDGAEVARRINARDEGGTSARRLVMELVDKRGDVRTRETLFFRRFVEGAKQTALFYLSPATIKDTAFLSYDYEDPAHADDQWLYLPALRRSRRIASADRGKSFLGTDLSYEDVKKETKVSLEDYTWRTLGEEVVDGHRCIRVEAVPVDERTARELGYGRVVSAVDAEIWLVRRADYWDTAGRELKTSRLSDVRQVDGIWTVHRIEVENHRTGHRTVFKIDQVRYGLDLPDDLFTEAGLRRGPPPL